MEALSTLSRSSHQRFAGLYLGPWNLLWERPMPLDTSLYPLLRDLFFYWQLSCSESQPPSENDKLYKCKSQLLYLRLIYFTRVSSLKKYPRRRFLSDLQIYPLLGHDEILLMDFILAVIYSSAKLWNFSQAIWSPMPNFMNLKRWSLALTSLIFVKGIK